MPYFGAWKNFSTRLYHGIGKHTPFGIDCSNSTDQTGNLGSLCCVPPLEALCFVSGSSAAQKSLVHKSRQIRYCDHQEYFAESRSLCFLSALVAVFFDADTLLLSHLRGDQEVAYYQAGMKIIVSLTVIPHILDSSFLPVLSRAQGKERF